MKKLILIIVVFMAKSQVLAMQGDKKSSKQLSKAAVILHTSQAVCSLDKSMFFFIRENGDCIDAVTLKQAETSPTLKDFIQARESSSAEGLWDFPFHYYIVKDEISDRLIKLIAHYLKYKNKAMTEEECSQRDKEAESVVYSQEILNFYFLAYELQLEDILSGCDRYSIKNDYFKAIFNDYRQQKELGINSLTFEEKLNRLTFGRADFIVEECKKDVFFWEPIIITHNHPTNRVYKAIDWDWRDGGILNFHPYEGFCTAYHCADDKVIYPTLSAVNINCVMAYNTDNTKYASIEADGSCKLWQARPDATKEEILKRLQKKIIVKNDKSCTIS